MIILEQLVFLTGEVSDWDKGIVIDDLPIITPNGDVIVSKLSLNVS